MKILDVDVSCVNRRELLDRSLAWAIQEQHRTIAYVNAHCMNIATKDHAYRAILNNADLVYSDGIGVVWASRLLGGCPLEKITGRDWIYDFCELAMEKQLRIYILAGKTGIAIKARRNLLQRYPQLQIVGSYDGYFIEKSPAEIFDDLTKSNPHVLLAGMSTPLQEKWITAHRNEISAPVCWVVGALFDYVAGVESPSPDWMNTLAMEWFWRMLLDPLGKWHRYLIGNPVFVYRILRQKMFTR